MWQTVLVIVIVTASAIYALWLLLTAPLRARLAGWLVARLPRAKDPPGWLRAWLEKTARPAAPATGCDACPQSRLQEPGSGRPPGTS